MVRLRRTRFSTNIAGVPRHGRERHAPNVPPPAAPGSPLLSASRWLDGVVRAGTVAVRVRSLAAGRDSGTRGGELTAVSVLVAARSTHVAYNLMFPDAGC